MLTLLNTKVLLVIATLLAGIFGAVLAQEHRAHAAEERRVAAEKYDKERWEKVKKYEQTESSDWSGH